MSDVNDDSIYSTDGRTLLKVPDVETFRIREGVWSIDEYAFEGCSRLREVDVPYTVTFFEDGHLAENACMRHAPEGLKLNLWDCPYPENCAIGDELKKKIANGRIDENGFVYSQDGKRLLKAGKRVEEYWIPEGVEQIERLAFIGCMDMQAKWIPPGHVPTEEELRAKVREAIDRYGPGGNIAIMCAIAHPAVDFRATMPLLHDEVVKYGTGYYG
jgi:hypothetical protein